MPAPIRFVQDSHLFPDVVDVVVIGAGIAGTATAYELARKGVSVVLIEKGLRSPFETIRVLDPTPFRYSRFSDGSDINKPGMM